MKPGGDRIPPGESASGRDGTESSLSTIEPSVQGTAPKARLDAKGELQWGNMGLRWHVFLFSWWQRSLWRVRNLTTRKTKNTSLLRPILICRTGWKRRLVFWTRPGRSA